MGRRQRRGHRPAYWPVYFPARRMGYRDAEATSPVLGWLPPLRPPGRRSRYGQSCLGPRSRPRFARVRAPMEGSGGDGGRGRATHLKNDFCIITLPDLEICPIIDSRTLGPTCRQHPFGNAAHLDAAPRAHLGPNNMGCPSLLFGKRLERGTSFQAMRSMSSISSSHCFQSSSS